MKLLLGAALAALLAGTATAALAPQPITNPPLDDTRVQISTLVREDLFAGILEKDMKRQAIGEANIEKLLASRPNDRAGLLAWKGGAELNRAALAREAGKKAEYRRHYDLAVAAFAEGDKAADANQGTRAIVSGASQLLFADRLDKKEAAAMWALAYDNYQQVWKVQGAYADKLPPHLRGELMAGMVMTAQRTGRQAEADAALDKMLVITKGGEYELMAQQWKDNPKVAPKTSLSCKNCHDDGRLGPTLARMAAAKPS
jgi:hypothetical protein